MPTEELENELRHVFARAAADIQDPEQARQRLLQRDYRPERGHRRLASGITAATAAAAVVLHMTMPPDQVARRGRAVRTHRGLLRGLTGAVALAGAAAAAVALLVPGGHPVTAQLAAWTVTTFPDGGIKVSIYQMKDPAGLQATLRADGIPARVTFNPEDWEPLPAGCTAPDMSRANGQILNKILTPPAIWSWQQQSNGGEPSSTQAMPKSLQRLQLKETWAKGYPAVYINRAAIPAGIGLYIGADIKPHVNRVVLTPQQRAALRGLRAQYDRHHRTGLRLPTLSINWGEDLVVTSPQCTGS
jgi:hypothetical protein